MLDIVYKPANDANGSFAIAGALFFCILYYVIFALGEVPSTVMGRRLLLKHRALGFYHPAAYTIAQIITDIPLYALQTLMFSAILYFLVGLNSGAQYFFTFWLPNIRVFWRRWSLPWPTAIRVCAWFPTRS